MNASMEELRRLTGATHTRKVIRGLIELGIPFKVADGRPVVLTSAIERALGAAPDTDSSKGIDMAARLARVNGGTDGTKKAQRPGTPRARLQT